MIRWAADTPLRVFGTAEIHALAAVDFALAVDE